MSLSLCAHLKSEQDINQLVEAFYTKAITGPTIGHIFTDVAKLGLETHLPIICDFWESILLGNPMLKHLELAEQTALTQVHFESWLAMWEQTVRISLRGTMRSLPYSGLRILGV